MKQLFAFCAGLLAVLNQTAVTALAAEPEAAGAAAQTPLWLCIPFAGLLLCIAVLPLVKAEWWEAHQPHAVVFWSPAIPDPVRREVRCAEGGGDDTGMYHKRLPDIHRPSFRIVLCVR